MRRPRPASPPAVAWDQKSLYCQVGPRVSSMKQRGASRPRLRNRDQRRGHPERARCIAERGADPPGPPRVPAKVVDLDLGWLRMGFARGRLSIVLVQEGQTGIPPISVSARVQMLR